MTRLQNLLKVLAKALPFAMAVNHGAGAASQPADPEQAPDPSAGSGYDAPVYSETLKAPLSAAARTSLIVVSFEEAVKELPSVVTADDELDAPAIGKAHPDVRSATQRERFGPWFDREGISPEGRALIAAIADARSHGLDREAFDYSGLRRAVLGLPAASLAGTDERSPARAAVTYRLRRAFTRFATTLGRGAVDARANQKRLFRDPPSVNARGLLNEIEAGHMTVDAALAKVAPSHPTYARLRERLRDLIAEQETGVVRQFIPGFNTREQGHSGHDVMLTKRRLVQTGDLDPAQATTARFDRDLTEALMAFQERSALPVNGQLDRTTRRALNRSVLEDMDDIALSLERWRWMPRDLGDRHLFVNLPSYRLQLFEGELQLTDMKVVIGDTDHTTPGFSQNMSYIEFNPTWTVPSKITNNELIPIERRSPGYLAKRNFDVLKRIDGKTRAVHPSTLTRAELRSSRFPYLLRQRPGKRNALGRMKFMMPNPYAIYLHDTPSKRFFALEERAYSHGCIRVADPMRLASRILQIDGRSPDILDKILAKPKTRRLSLSTPIPTHLAYFTTTIDKSGRLVRYNDIYSNDATLRQSLRLHHALPSSWLPSA